MSALFPTCRSKGVSLRFFLFVFIFFRCNFAYDSIGNLYKKSCAQTEVQYIIDPFGNPGADIVGKVKDILAVFQSLS